MPSIEVSINGRRTLVPDATSVEAALRGAGFALRHAAVALNESLLPRDAYGSQLLRAGDALEVLTPFAGG